MHNEKDERAYIYCQKCDIYFCKNQSGCPLCEEKERRAAKERKIAIDPLTGVFSNHLFKELAQKEFERANRGGAVFSLLFLDVDGLKRVNDEYGHIEGNRLLKQVADFLKDFFRQADMIFRFGGDEFVVVLPKTGQRKLNSLSKRLKLAVEEEDFSFSFGGVTWTPGLTLGQLTERADALMYEEKKKKKAAKV